MTHDENWQARLATLRTHIAREKGENTNKEGAKKKSPHKSAGASDGLSDRHLSQEALMKLASIMQDDSDPRLQIAAAKTLLSTSAKYAEKIPENAFLIPDEPMSADECDTLLAVAKNVLDELAARKAGSVDGAGAMAADGTPTADNAKG